MPNDHFESSVKKCSIEATSITASLSIMWVFLGHFPDLYDKWFISCILDLQHIQGLIITDQRTFLFDFLSNHIVLSLQLFQHFFMLSRVVWWLHLYKNICQLDSSKIHWSRRVVSEKRCSWLLLPITMIMRVLLPDWKTVARQPPAFGV